MIKRPGQPPEKWCPRGCPGGRWGQNNLTGALQLYNMSRWVESRTSVSIGISSHEIIDHLCHSNNNSEEYFSRFWSKTEKWYFQAIFTVNTANLKSRKSLVKGTQRYQVTARGEGSMILFPIVMYILMMRESFVKQLLNNRYRIFITKVRFVVSLVSYRVIQMKGMNQCLSQ